MHITELKIMNTELDFDSYAKNMRLTFSNKEMIDDDGSINHKYFLVKKGAYWSTKEDEALIRGLELFGINFYYIINIS